MSLCFCAVGRGELIAGSWAVLAKAKEQCHVLSIVTSRNHILDLPFCIYRKIRLYQKKNHQIHIKEKIAIIHSNFQKTEMSDYFLDISGCVTFSNIQSVLKK